MAKSYEMDMCNGPILGKVLTYSIPLMLCFSFFSMRQM